MGIQVKCPKGHEFKVKDKYAGKKGLCPMCKDQTVVQVPDILSTATEALAAERRRLDPLGDSHILGGDDDDDDGSSGSLLSGSFVQNRIICKKCGTKVPMWFAKCNSCGEFIDHR